MEKNELICVILMREKFGITKECIQTLINQTQDCPVVFLHTGIPKSLSKGLEQLSENEPRFRTHQIASHFMLPNDVLNVAMEKFGEQYKYMLTIDNDVVLENNAIEAMVTCARQTGSAVIQPLLLEGREDEVHYDPPISKIQLTDDGVYTYCARTLEKAAERFPRIPIGDTGVQRRIYHVERHCLLLEPEGLKGIFPLEPYLNTREWLDLSLRLFVKNVAIHFEPNATARYIIKPVSQEDSDYFQLRWDKKLAEFSNEYVKNKWNILNFLDSNKFVAGMNRYFKAAISPQPNVFRGAPIAANRVVAPTMAFPRYRSGNNHTPAPMSTL